MPEGENLAALARSGATLAIHLSIRSIGAVCEALAPAYGADCPAAVVYRASWPDERIVTGTLADLPEKVRPLRLRRTALILVGRVLAAETFDDSALYDAAHPPPPPPPEEAPDDGLSRGGNRAAREPERGKPAPASQPQGADCRLIASQAPRRDAVKRKRRAWHWRVSRSAISTTT